jgi:hypothetical protein
MKKLTSTLLLVLALATASAQTATTNTNPTPATSSTNAPTPFPPGSPTPPANFFATIQSYFTSVDTNYTWISNRTEIAAGGDYMGGIEWANYVSGQYDFGRWDLEGKIRNIGVAGAIESFEGGGGYSFIQTGSLKLQGSVLLGYDFNREAALFEPQVVVKKKATTNTYLELGAGVPLWLQKSLNDRPNFFIGAGFTY